MNNAIKDQIYLWKAQYMFLEWMYDMNDSHIV